MLKRRLIVLGLTVLFGVLIISTFGKSGTTAFALQQYNFEQDGTKYLRVTDDCTVFYQDENFLEPMFFLPYTYYVKILNESENYYHVEFGHADAPVLDGFVKKDDLYYDGLEVVDAFPRIALTTLTTAVLYRDGDCTTSIQYVFSGRELHFYGSYVNSSDKRVYCVSYNGKLGYVAEETVEPFFLPNHPNELTFLKPTITPPIDNEKPPATSADGSSDLVMKIIIIGCLIFAGIIALYIALRPKKDRKNQQSYYDENDYE